jgi:hypothetical protein
MLQNLLIVLSEYSEKGASSGEEAPLAYLVRTIG